jgi:hypothetical protein
LIDGILFDTDGLLRLLNLLFEAIFLFELEYIIKKLN